MSEPRVAVHVDANGDWSVFADAGVTVFCVSDLTPQDRVYRYTNMPPIPLGMLDGPVGFHGDRSAAETRAHRASAAIEGRPHLNLVERGDE